MLFGSTARAAVTTVTADQMLNDGRLTAAGAGAAADGLTGMFRRAIGLDGPDGQMDLTRMAGMGVAATVGTIMLDKVMGGPLAIIAALALAYIFRDQIGGLAHSFARATGLETGPETGPQTPAADAPSPAFQRGLEDLSRLSRGLTPQP